MDIGSVIGPIASLLTKSRPKYIEMPPVLVMASICAKSGMSSSALATSVISRLPEIGIPNGKNPDGSDSVVNEFVALLCDEIVREIKMNSVTVSCASPGTLNISGTGMGPSGPITFTGTNVTPAVIKGINI